MNAITSTPDLWDNAGPFFYRILPEQCLADFFSDERPTVRISESLGSWWVAVDGEQGETPYTSLKAAKEAADADILTAEAELNQKLLSEAGLSGDEWRISFENIITIEQIDGPYSIVANIRDAKPYGQSWDAYDGNDIVASALPTVPAALQALNKVSQ